MNWLLWLFPRTSTPAKPAESVPSRQTLRSMEKATAQLQEADKRLEKARTVNADLKRTMERNHIRESIQHAIREKQEMR
ncbi:hypothetical protein ACFYOC_24165 [Nocardiopsis alba]|uniref:DUF7620 family protein n=1 Tax=Nocardiopsis alba TaxID=53437 RepID=UPI0033AA8FFF